MFISLFAFVTRLFFPIGSDVLNLQLGFFPAYITMFVFGIVAYHNHLFEKIDYRKGKKLLLASLVIGIPAWLLLMFYGGPFEGEMSIEGGYTWPALFYALWESFICVFFILGLIGVFRKRFNSQNKLQHFLSDNAFGVFVFHAPILILISMMLKEVELAPVIKFFVVSLLAVVSSFLFSWLVRRVKLFKKIFS